MWIVLGLFQQSSILWWGDSSQSWIIDVPKLDGDYYSKKEKKTDGDNYGEHVEHNVCMGFGMLQRLYLQLTDQWSR